MAIIALHAAATGLSALSTEIDVIANNLSNTNTSAFKASRVNFEDLLYQELAQPGVENANGDQRPAGIYVGLGTRISNTAINFTQGSAIQTGNEMDLMIDGPGFFGVALPPDIGDGVGYSRAGNFFVNSEGEMVLGNSDGPRLEPPIVVPPDALKIDVTSDGRVFVTVPGDPEAQEVGQISLFGFINSQGLKPHAGNIYLETAASGPPIEAAPEEGGLGSITQGFLEGSNVDPVRELIALIKAQRAFELNSQTIQAADQALQVVANLRRF